MYLQSLLLAVSLATLSSGLPSSQTSCKPFTDNFENIAGAAGGRGTISVYNGVTYQAFNAAAKSPVTGSTGEVIPHSGKQDIVAGVGNDLVQLGSLTLNPFGKIIASPSKSFDLTSFWFGCGANIEQPAASTAIGCVLAVTGVTSAGKQVPVVTFSYAPTNPLASPMNFAALPGTFRDLKSITFGVAAGTAPSTLTALWLDDVSHCNYS